MVFDFEFYVLKVLRFPTFPEKTVILLYIYIIMTNYIDAPKM